MNPFASASTAPELKRPAPEIDTNDDELAKALEAAFVAPPQDSVARYHEMIRRALVDWGDEIIDTLIEKFADTPKIRAQMEEVRADLIDPLRARLV